MTATTGPQSVRLEPGLYFVATPIGTARDVTLRALDILASADVIAAEDTRTARRLMELHGISVGGRPLVAYHDHNGAAQRPRLLAALAEGKSVAYVSEAGTPLVADPGFVLGRAVIEAGYLVTSAPGPSAVLAALTVSGLPSDRFMFVGFAPTAQGARRSFLSGLKDTQATLVLYESPKRLGKLLTDAVAVFGADRPAVICRELTKKFEETRRGTLMELTSTLTDMTLKGEIVVLIDRAPPAKPNAADVEAALREAMLTLSLKDASKQVADAMKLAKRDVYQLGLAMAKTNDT